MMIEELPVSSDQAQQPAAARASTSGGERFSFRFTPLTWRNFLCPLRVLKGHLPTRDPGWS